MSDDRHPADIEAASTGLPLETILEMRADQARYESHVLFQEAMGERLTPDDYAPGADAHDRYFDL